ncbi:MAG: YbjN domain-containing protein [Ktedonobacterales bacterium]|nr:YbjN domain-containing protein [Ktedonobacterales bacterium]
MGQYRPSLNLETVETIFRRHGWHYEVIESHIVTAFDDVLMVIGVDEAREILLMWVPLVPGKGMQGYVPVRPEAERDAALYMMAVNYQLALGAFTRDHHDGEIRYEVSLLLLGSALSDAQLEASILITVAAVTHHAPVINNILTGRTTVKQALDDLDSGHRSGNAMAV